MDRSKKDIRALEEYILGAVAMMIIDIKNCHGTEPVSERCLRCDCSIVEVAIAAHVIDPGMMAGGTAEGESASFAGRNGADPAQGSLR